MQCRRGARGDPEEAVMNAMLKAWTPLVLSALLAACASTSPPPQQPERLFADELFHAPTVKIDATDVFALTPDMAAYLEHDIARLVRTRGRQQGLYEALYTRGQLQLEYDAAKTRNAAEAFAARQGNCLSLVIMTAAFAKELGLNVRYQNVYGEETWARDGDLYLSVGHVNLSLGRRQVQAEFGRNETDSMTIDFLPTTDIRSLKTWTIEEPTIVAMYLNNRAVESLTVNDLDDAYWWAREAILQEPRFMTAYNTLGVVYQKHGNLAEAQRAFEFVLEREPANTRSLSNLAEVFYSQGRVGAARDIKAKLDKMEPNPPFGYYKRGIAAMQEGNYKLAKEMFTKEIERAAYYHEFHFWLALAEVGLGEMDAARRHMAMAVENSTTRKDHDLYAAKLERIRETVPVLRR
jgi:tetratricopeptide (TPR) repeat protein